MPPEPWSLLIPIIAAGVCAIITTLGTQYVSAIRAKLAESEADKAEIKRLREELSKKEIPDNG